MSRPFTAQAVQVLTTPDPGSFHTTPVPQLMLDLEGIPGDRHHGFTRRAGPREPWYQRGTLIRSGRQLSIVSAEELAAVAQAMGLPRIDPAWIGANILLAGVPDLSALPWGTRLFFGNEATTGAVLVNEGDNAPCRQAGAGIAAAYPDRAGLDRLFVKLAKHRRGIVASVERAGLAAPGEVALKTPPIKIWPGAKPL